MEVFVLHILKLNIIAAIVILLVKLLARPLKNKVSARWKYFIWMFVVLSLLIPIRLPAAVSIVNFKVQQSVTESGGQRKVQTTEFSDTAQPVNENIQNLAGVSIQKPSAIHENGKWAGIAAGIQKLGLNQMDLAIRYLLVGLLMNFISGWATDLMTTYVSKQQGITLSKTIA